ncbi:hypothetical protein [Streptomyces sp. 7-21]|jgi:hypothetical protein|uniref:hypothetical protein n=1 Tax=Streptomyces sp. 7-21 TaxID=2802283 RepID=UPI00191EE1FB|nr:hypothetical protein [Streptomyces sp. 7-21]MBL1068248.1 hypothetical protein [Streptomyces sp. 7-21]
MAPKPSLPLPPASPALFRAVNRVVRPVLRSPFHWLFSHWLMLVTYTGVTSGREYSVPVMFYYWTPGEVWAFTGRESRWAGNLKRPGATARLRMRGRDVEVTAEVVEERDAVAGLLRELIARKGPKAVKDPYLGLPRDREPTPEEAAVVASELRVVRFRIAR